MTLREVLDAVAAAELARGERRGFVRPIRWSVAAMVRCESGHVMKHATRPRHIDSGAFCRRPGCSKSAALTFPEDKDGSLCPP